MNKFSKILESTSPKFSLGIDVHGVIDSLPSEFSFLTNLIVSAGGHVHIITGSGWNSDLESKLKSINIAWTHQFSVYDHLIETNSEILGEVEFPDGTVQKKFNNIEWDKVKGEYCAKNNISLHIDDTLSYNEFFRTPFCRFWSHNNSPKASHKDRRHLD